MIAKDNGAEAKCEFCGEVYQANGDHLCELIEELRSRTDSPNIRRR
jgi:molecular chaperone Hsp33